MNREIEIAEKNGFEVIRSLPHQSCQEVLLAKKNQQYFVLKWPEQHWKEREALSVWQGSVGPKMTTLEDALVLEYFSGRNPFYWQEDDLPKITALFKKMQEKQPGAIDQFPPLEHLLEKIIAHLQKSPLKEATEAIESLKKASQKKTKKQLIHGDLHPWNIFLRDKANLINPYGLSGDPGFDLAFLAASLAHDQEKFLETASQELSLQTASDWLPGLVVYRLDSTIRKQEKAETRILEKLVNRIWGA